MQGPERRPKNPTLQELFQKDAIRNMECNTGPAQPAQEPVAQTLASKSETEGGETEKQVKVPGRNCAFSALAGALTGFSDGNRSRRQPRWKGRREKKTAKNTARRDTTEQKNMRDGGAARRG